MLIDVTERLESLGYTYVAATDDWMLNFISTKVEGYIKSECNLSAIPEGLHEVAVDMVCGEFLQNKKAINQLADFNLDAAVKSIKEGDTQITFALNEGSLTPEARLDMLLNHLINSGKGSFASYRSIGW
jgi:hypothetical protein